jgi:undecaprenyl pyrophosphate synthase
MIATLRSGRLRGSIVTVAKSIVQPASEPLDVPQQRRPRHIAIIMDGNGRWAQRRGLPRIEGHRHGVAAVRRITEEAARIATGQLTLYCLSSENWKRPKPELDFLMHLLEQYLVEERATLLQENIRLAVIGNREGIPAAVLREMDKTIEMSAGNTGMTLWRSTMEAGQKLPLRSVALPTSFARGCSCPKASPSKRLPTGSTRLAWPIRIC